MFIKMALFTNDEMVVYLLNEDHQCIHFRSYLGVRIKAFQNDCQEIFTMRIDAIKYFIEIFKVYGKFLI